eukprot:1191205-Prorocentrum_minimum.AAC.2
MATSFGATATASHTNSHRRVSSRNVASARTSNRCPPRRHRCRYPYLLRPPPWAEGFGSFPCSGCGSSRGSATSTWRLPGSLTANCCATCCATWSETCCETCCESCCESCCETWSGTWSGTCCETCCGTSWSLSGPGACGPGCGTGSGCGSGCGSSCGPVRATGCGCGCAPQPHMRLERCSP